MSQATATESRAQTSDLILDAAEAVFSDRGFEGATTRAIAEIAGVNLALIHYHFGTKEALYEAAFTRRATEINGARRTRLAEVLATDPRLEPLLEAFFRPSIEIGHKPNGGGHYYARMVANGASGTDERSRQITARHYNTIAREFIAAMERIVPGLDRPRAVRGYLFATSISVSSMANTGRAAVLSDGACTDDDTEALITQAVRFCAAGIRALTDT